MFRENSEETCRRYARIGKVFLSHPNALEKLKVLDGLQGASIGAAHMDHEVYSSLDNEGVMLFIDALYGHLSNTADTSKGKAASRGAFPSSLFYSYVNDKYEICRYLYNDYGRPAKMTFPEFLAKEIPPTKTKMINIRQCFVSQVRLFENGKEKHSDNNLRRVRKFEARVSKRFTGEVPIRSTDKASVEGGKQNIQEVTTRPQLRDSTTSKETVRYEPEPTRTSSRNTSGRKVRNKTVVITDYDQDDQDNEFEVVPLSPDKVPEKDAMCCVTERVVVLR